MFEEEIRRFSQQYKLLQEGVASTGTGGGNGSTATGDGDLAQAGDEPIIEIDGESFTEADVLQWREDSANKSKWQKEYTQRDQALADERKKISQERPAPATTVETKPEGVTRLTGKMIEEALGPDGNDFNGLANAFNKTLDNVRDEVRKDVTTGIKSEQVQDQMINDFIGRHKEWDEYTAPGGKVSQYLTKMPNGYPPEAAFLEVLLQEERASKAQLIEDAKKQGFKLGEQKATRDMGTKGRINTLRGTPPGGKPAETALSGDEKEKAMIDKLKSMRGEA